MSWKYDTKQGDNSAKYQVDYIFDYVAEVRQRLLDHFLDSRSFALHSDDIGSLAD